MMIDALKRIVEINGVKLEVDLRTAKRVDQFKVGDGVKVLKKNYGDNYQTHIGVIVGFDEFKNLPSITVAYIEDGYNETKMTFASINSKTSDIEITSLNNFEQKFSYGKALEKFDRDIEKLKNNINDIQSKKEWFVKNYDSYFKDHFTNVIDE